MAKRIRKLYIVAALLAAITILVWIKFQVLKLGTDQEDNVTSIQSKLTVTRTGMDSSQISHTSTKFIKLERIDQMNEVCRRHKYTVDSTKPRFLNCTNLFRGSLIEQNKVKHGHDKKKWAVPFKDAFYRQALNCDWLHKQLNVGYYVSKEEKQFPLAFALNVHQSPYQIFRFLKVIYRPHNLYCIHYDKKSDEHFKKLIDMMARCLPNVIVTKKIEDVIWGWHTIVDAQMNCLNALYKKRSKYLWKYVITLCGKEVPLRTNREMVDTLRKLNGTSAVNLEAHKEFEYDYWKYEHHLVDNVVTQSNISLGLVPYNLNISKGMAYFAVSRQFVSFLLHNKKVKIFREFMDKTYIPDEHFIATLYNTEGVPGGQNNKFNRFVPTISSYMWMYFNNPLQMYHFNPRQIFFNPWQIFFNPWQMHFCKGTIVHDICIVTAGDLHKLDHSYDPDKDHQTFFHNKFFIERDRVVMDCAEEELLRRNRQECLTDTQSLTTVHVKNFKLWR